MGWFRTSQSYNQSVRMARAYENDEDYQALCDSFSGLVSRIYEFICCSCFPRNQSEAGERAPLRAPLGPRVHTPLVAPVLPLPIPPATGH